MEIRGSNSDGLYHMDIASDTVLTGMNDVVIDQQSVKNGIQYCMEQLNYMLRADVYYQSYYTHDT